MAVSLSSLLVWATWWATIAGALAANWNATAWSNTTSNISSSLSLSNTTLRALLVPTGTNKTSLFSFGDIPQATSCMLEWRTYTRVSSSHEKLVRSSTTLTNYTTSKWASDPPPPKITTLCDGHPRLIAEVDHYTNITYPTFVSTTSWWINNYTEPTPTCSVGRNECSQLSNSYISASSAKSRYFYSLDSWSRSNKGSTRSCDDECNFWKTWVISDWLYGIDEYGGCTKPPDAPMTGTCGHGCSIIANTVRMMYFPVSVVGDRCGNQTTITAAPTIAGKPNTAVINETTYTSGYVYLSFNLIGALSQAYQISLGPTPFTQMQTCGSIRTNYVYSIRSSELSSLGISYGYGTAAGTGSVAEFPFNFADLNYEYAPFSVYENGLGFNCNWSSACTGFKPGEASAQSDCISFHKSVCSSYTVPYGGYSPLVNIPEQLTRIDPMWSACTTYQLGVEDPPVALQTVQGIAESTPTPISPVHTDPATPGSAIMPPRPAATSSPEPVEPLIPPTSIIPLQGGEMGDSDSGAIPINIPGAIPSDPLNLSPSDHRPASGPAPLPQNLPGGVASGNSPQIGPADIPTSDQQLPEDPQGPQDSQDPQLPQLPYDPQRSQAMGAVISIGNTPATVISKDGHFVIGTRTISLGSAITISGIPLSFGTNGVHVGSTTMPFSQVPGPFATSSRNTDESTSTSTKTDIHNQSGPSGTSTGATASSLAWKTSSNLWLFLLVGIAFALM